MGRPVAGFIFICSDWDMVVGGKGGSCCLLFGGERLRRSRSCAIWLQGLLCSSWLFSTPSSDLYQIDKRAAEQSKKQDGYLLTLSVLFLLYVWKFHIRKLEQDGQKGIHASAVWYLLSCEKTFFKCQICLAFCVISFPSLSIFPSHCHFHLCTQLPSLPFASLTSSYLVLLSL